MVKKIIYGSFFLLVFSAIVGGGYYFWNRQSISCSDNLQNQDEEEVDCGGLCISCALKNAHQLFINPAEIFSLGGKTIILFEIENPNTKLSLVNLPYTIKLLGEGDKELVTVHRETFIYPGSVRYLIESFSDIKQEDVKKAGLAANYTKDSWEEGIEVPTVMLSAVRKNIENGEFVFRGDVINENAFPLKDVSVYVFLNNNLGFRIAAVKSLMGEIEPFSQKQFKIIVPINKEFDEKNINTNVGVEARR